MCTHTHCVNVPQNVNMNTGSMSKEYYRRTKHFFDYNFMNIKYETLNLYKTIG